MKKSIAFVILALICFLLQTSLFSYLRLADITPNLLIILTVTTAISCGKLDGMMIGLLCGLMYDLTFGHLFGMFTLLYILVGYFCGLTAHLYYKDDLTYPLVSVALSDLFYGIYVYVLSFLTRGRLDIFFYFRRIILPEMAYTVILTIFVYRILFTATGYFKTKGSENLIV